MLFLIPIVIASLIWHFRRFRPVGDTRCFPQKRRSRPSRRAAAFWLTALSASLALGAASNPSLRHACKTPTPAVPNLAFILDMSGSMEASDWPDGASPRIGIGAREIPPPRIATAKAQLLKLLDNCPDARAALLAFADNTVLIAPLSPNHHVLKERLNTIQTEHFSDGTAIGQAIAAATRSLRCAPNGPQAIIVISDGVDHTANTIAPEDAARLAAEQGIVIHAVGIGGKNAFHPVSTDAGIRWENVGEPMDMQQLQNICAVTGGKAFLAKDAHALADAVRHIQTRIRQQTRDFLTPRRLALAPCLLVIAALLAIASLALATHTAKRP